MSVSKNRVLDFLFMLTGAIFTVIIMASLEQIEFSILKLVIYSFAGCLAGFGLRAIVLRQINGDWK